MSGEPRRPPLCMNWDAHTERVLDLCMDTFRATAVVYVTQEGAEISIRGIFDNAFVSVDPNTQAAVQSVGPVLGIKLSDLPRAPRVGDFVIVNNKRFSIDHVEKDVHGGANLFLHKAGA